MAARVGTTAPKPASNKMVDTTHLRLLAGETEAFSASEKGGWPWAKSEDTLVATNHRVLFMWRAWMCGMGAGSHEESFNLDDLQFMTLSRGVSWMWLWGGLVSVLFGAIIMAMGSTFNPKKHSGMSSRTPSEFGSTAVSIEDSMESTYKSMMGAGVAVLLAGVLCIVLFIRKHLSRSVYLSLNFSRRDADIVDWASSSSWRPSVSSTRRLIKLPKETAQEAYNTLQQQLHNRFSVKVNLRDPRARESAHDS